MGRLNRAQADAYSKRVDAALAAMRANNGKWDAYDREVKREAYNKLGAYHILKLARKLGVLTPSDPDARESFSIGREVQRRLGI